MIEGEAFERSEPGPGEIGEPVGVEPRSTRHRPAGIVREGSAPRSPRRHCRAAAASRNARSRSGRRVFRTRIASAAARSRSNQCQHWPAVTRSYAASSAPVRSAVAALYATVTPASASIAAASCNSASEGSSASTRRPSPARPRATVPVPVPRSSARNPARAHSRLSSAEKNSGGKTRTVLPVIAHGGAEIHRPAETPRGANILSAHPLSALLSGRVVALHGASSPGFRPDIDSAAPRRVRPSRPAWRGNQASGPNCVRSAGP